MMEYRDGMFQTMLGEYSFAEIKDAFLQHVKRSPNLPTPSHIINILDPEPVFDYATYVEICEKIREDAVYVTQAERRYKDAYEQEKIRKGLGKKQ